MRIGMLTGGGDCPGLNAVIRAVVRKGIDAYGDQLIGFRDGWRGVLEPSFTELTIESTPGILPQGGTILGSSRTIRTSARTGFSGSGTPFRTSTWTASSRSAARTPSASPTGSTATGST